MSAKRSFRPSSCVLFLLLALPLLFSGCDRVSTLYPGQPNPPADSALEVHFIDVGQADSALLLCGGESMLIDGGNVADSSLVVSYLAERGVDSLDYVVCTHAHEDHVGGLSGPLSQFQAGVVLSPVREYDSKAFEDFVTYTNAQNLELTIPSPGNQWILGGAKVTVLGPLTDYEETNNTSIVLRVDYGETSFLFTGDMERSAELDLVESGAALSATVLKIGHHGSATSSSYLFLREVNPQYAVISVGRDNSYGHPDEAVMSRLRDANVPVYRTDMQGTIVAVSDGSTVSFATETNSSPNTNPDRAETYGTYIGNRNSHIYHRPDCSGLPAEQNQVYFEHRQAAEEAGYTPCSRCKP